MALETGRIAFQGTLGAGQCVRIMTGAVMPPGADTVVIQEVVKRERKRVVVPPGQKQALERGVRTFLDASVLDYLGDAGAAAERPGRPSDAVSKAIVHAEAQQA